MRRAASPLQRQLAEESRSSLPSLLALQAKPGMWGASRQEECLLPWRVLNIWR